jgi:hypothetical protein
MPETKRAGLEAWEFPIRNELCLAVWRRTPIRAAWRSPRFSKTEVFYFLFPSKNRSKAASVSLLT